MADLTGKRLGKYELVERLGRGGMAEVYKSYQPGMDRFVAIKVMHSHLAESEDFVTRFKREAQLVGQLRHPHIVQVIDFDVQDEGYYMVMEYIKGETLKYYIQQKGALDPNEALRITSQLADALHYAHQEGMIHRDIKPANVMFTDNSYTHPVLTDFGIARIISGGTQLTASGAFVGTPAYISPEIARGEQADERSDIYSMGIMLYEMLTGKVPYDADTPFAVIMKHVNEPLPSPRQINLNVTDSIERVLFTALAKSPSERYQSAAEFRDALNEALGVVPHERPTVSGEGRGTEMQNQATATMSRDQVDDLATIITDSQQIAGASPPTMLGDRQKRSNLPRILAGVVALIAIVALLYVFVLQPDEDDDTDITDNTPVPTATTGPTATPELVVADVGDYDNSLVEQGQYGRAISNYSIAINQDPENPIHFVRRAEAYAALYLENREADNRTKAEDDFTTALDFNPNYNPAYLVRGRFYSNLGEYDLALADFNRALELDSDSADLYAERGMVYFLQDDQTAATTDFIQALSLDTSNSLAYLGQARISLENGDLPSTFATLSLALEADPEFAEAYALRGSLHLEEGNLDEAKTDFDRAINLDSRLTEAYVGRAMYYEEVGNTRLATRDYSTALGQRPTAEVYLLRAKLYLDDEAIDLAEADLQAALALDNTLVEAYVDLAQIEEDEGEVERAVEAYSQALELDETLDDARLSRAWLYYDLENYEAAGQDFAYLVGQDAEHIEANLGLGDIAVEAEEYETAIDYYDKVLAQDDEYASAYFGRGLAYAQIEDYERAISDFNSALEFEYTEPHEAYFERGLAQQEIGNIEDALLDFTEAIDADPTYAPAYFYRGIANYEEGNIEIALADFNRASELGIEGGDSELLKYRGIALSLAGDSEAALADFETVLAEDPENEEVLYYRATTLISLEQYDTAIDDLTTLIENNYDELGLAYLQRGIAYRESRNSDRALDDFDRAVDLIDDNAVAYFQRGLTYWHQDRTEQAESDFSAALAEDDSLAEAYYYRGNVYLLKNEYELALEDLNLAIENEYDPLEHAYLTRGVAYYRMGDNDEAIRDYTEAVKINPSYGLAYFNRGIAYSSQEDYQRAVANFTLAIDNDYQDLSNTYYERGLAYDYLEEYAKARDDYTEVINLNESHVADAYYERARMHLFLGDYQEAVDDNTTLLDLEYDLRESVFNNRGVAYVEMGEYEFAIVDFNAAIQIDENYALAYANRALARRLNGDYERAVADYLQAEEVGYNNTFNLAYGLGISYYNLEDYEEALSQLNIAVNSEPEKVSNLINALFARGRTHVALGNVGAAIRNFDEVIALDAENVDAYYERGLVFMSEERWDFARDDFEQVLDLNAEYADAYYQLGFAHKELGNPDDALANLIQAVEHNPDLSDAYYLMADIYYEAGDLQLALANYDQYVALEGADANPRAVQRIAQLETALGDEARVTPVPSGDDDDDSTTTATNADRVPYGPAVVLNTDASAVAVQMSIVRGIAVNTDPQQALDELTAIIEADGETVPYVALRAELNLRLDNPEEALADANHAIELDPEHPAGYLVLAVYHTIYEYNEERALELAQLALSFAPNNGYVALVYADIQREFGRYDQALELYNTAEELEVPIVNVLVNRSALYFTMGDYENAIVDGERLLELNEFNSDLSLGLAGAYILNEQYEEAEAVVQARVARWGTDGVAYYANAAYVAYRNADYETAREWVNNTLAITEYPPATYTLGLIETAEGNYDEALAQFETLQDLPPWEYSGFFINPRYGHDLAVDKARIYRLQDDTQTALEILDEAIAADPGNGMPYLEKADILMEQGDIYGAQWNYLFVFTSTYEFPVIQLAQRRVLAQGPQLTFDLAYLMLHRFDSNAAWVLIEPALTHFPDNPEFRWLQARYLIQQDQIQEASILGEALVLEDEMSPYGYLIQADLAWYEDDQPQYVLLTEQAFSRAPEQPYVAFEHAQAMRFTNQVTVALNIYASAEFNGINQGLLLYERGRYLYELQRYEEAQANLAGLAEWAGIYTPAEAILLLLASTMHLDNYDEAGRLAGEFIEINLPDWQMPDYYANLAFVTYKAGDFDLANDLVERSLDIQPDNLIGRYVSALLMAHAGDFAGASEIFMDLDENTSIFDYSDPFINVEFGHLIWFDWGNVETAQENYEHAVELYTRTIDETSEEWFLPFVGRAQALAALGDFDGARTDLNRALILADELPESREMIEAQLAELDEREANAEPAEEAEPEATPAE